MRPASHAGARLPLGARAAVAMLAILPYLSGLTHDFVYDDHGAILENRFWSGADAWRRVLTLQTLRDPHVLDGQRPALLVSVLLDIEFGAVSPWRFRLTNVLLHAACALLIQQWLFALLLNSGEARPSARASWAACLFALHPAATEAVQGISFREDLLVLFWLMIALGLDRILRTALRLPLQAFSGLLALASKESGAALPMLMVAVWWCYPKVSRRRQDRVVAIGLYALLTVAWFAVIFSARPAQALGAEWNGLSLRPPENLLTAPYLFFRYAVLLAWPWPLCVDRVVVPVAGLDDGRFWVGGVATSALAVAAVASRRRSPLIALGLTWLFVMFLPISNLTPLLNPFADRYAYAMIPGFALVVAGSLPPHPAFSRALVAIVLIIYFALVTIRLGDWRNDEHLWRATLLVEPRSARAHSGLASLAIQRGDETEARVHCALADILNPREVTALINWAVIQGRRGDTAGALQLLRRAVERRPDKAEAWANLSVALRLSGRAQEAEIALSRARLLDPLGRY